MMDKQDWGKLRCVKIPHTFSLKKIIQIKILFTVLCFLLKPRSHLISSGPLPSSKLFLMFSHNCAMQYKRPLPNNV